MPKAKRYKFDYPKGKTVIGLTGAVASGKTEACRFFARLGACVISADALAALQLAKGGPAYKAVARRYGAKAFDEEGNINRQFLAGRIFSSPKAKKWLEAVIHPQVLKTAERIARLTSKKIIVFEVPLLFETDMDGCFDFTVCIDAPLSSRLRRARARGWSAAEFKRRAACQSSPAEKRRRADFVIRNNRTREALRKAINRFYKSLNLLVK